jgi:hypothetical protein
MICIAVLAFAQPSLRSAWSCKAAVVVLSIKCGSHTSMVGLRHAHLRLLLFFETPAVTLQGGAKRKSGDLEGFRALACFAFGRANRGSDPIPGKGKGSARKQQTHLNHVAMLIPQNPSSIFPQVTQICARAGTVVAARSRSTSSGGCSNDPSLWSTSASTRTHAQGGELTIHHPCVHSSSSKSSSSRNASSSQTTGPRFFLLSMLQSTAYHACIHSQTTDSRAPATE